MTTKENYEKKELEKIQDIQITETDSQTKQTIKKPTRLFKFQHTEVAYYTEEQLNYLYKMFGEKLKKCMENIFTYENASLKKQLIYTMVCKGMGESNVYFTLKKFDHPDTLVVDNLLVFLRNQLEELEDDKKNLEHRLKTKDISEEDYNAKIKKIEENIETINEALDKPKEEELTEEKLKEIEDNYEYYENITKQAYQRDVGNRKNYRTYIDFYGKALEENKSEMKISEKIEFK
jgi:hypothetical protein